MKVSNASSNSKAVQPNHQAANPVKTLVDPEFLSLADHKTRAFKGILDRNAEALARQRSEAAASIRADMRRAKSSPKGRSGRDFLAQVRARHVR